jgi:F-type H+-transporting ATPase subunit a
MSEGSSPLDQFKIKYYTDIPEVFGANINFTNSSMFMVFVVIAISTFLILSMKKRELVPGRWQSMAELAYELVANTLKENVGDDGRKYFPVVFSLFMFVLFCNLFGMLPYSFTVTSHVSITFALAAFVFIGVTLIAIFKHGIVKFLKFFLPEGTPLWLAPFIFVIELFAYLIRPATLSIRLAVNMMAGHIMLKIIAGFVIGLSAIPVVGIGLTAIPIATLIILTGFEIFIAVLQAYIFTVLTCVYLKDAVHLH